MSGEGNPKETIAPLPVPHTPPRNPGSGAGADTALEAMIRKRQGRAGSDTTLLPADGADIPAPK